MPIRYLDEEEEAEKPISVTPRYLDSSEEENPESLGELVGRAGARTGARIAEAGLGQVGDIRQLVETLAAQPGKLVPGEKGQRLQQAAHDPLGALYPDPEQRKLAEEFIRKAQFGGEPTPSLARAPTTAQLQAVSESEAPELLQARSAGEEATDEFTQDLTRLLTPAGGGKFLGSVLIAGAAQLSKQFVRIFGGTKNQQELARNGLLFTLSIARAPGAKKVAINELEEARAMVPPGAQVSSTPIKNSFQKIKKEPWFTSGNPPSTQPAKKLLTEAQEAIQGPVIDVDRLLELDRNANEYLGNLGQFQLVKRGDKAKARFHLNAVKDAINEGIQEYGKTSPEFLRQYRGAKRAYAIASKGNQIGEYIADHIPQTLKSHGAKAIFYSSLYGNAPGIFPTALGAAAAFTPPALAAKTLYRISKSPVLRRHYRNVIRNAAAKNAAALGNSLEKLDAELAKDETKEKKFAPPLRL
jgi:hypothetical protein